MTLIEFIHSENSKAGKRCSTEDIRKVINSKREVYKKLKEKTDSPSNKKFYDLLIEELDRLDRQSIEYDLIEQTLRSVRVNKFKNC